jgi:uncharacterized pyridoxamine 5'-phosphate oxidase family protein
MSNSLIQEIFRTQFFAVLSSVGKGQPYSNLVAFAVTTDLKYLIFVTNRNTLKHRNIIRNKKVSLLIDNRTNNPADVEKATAITVIGYAHEETDINKAFHDVYLVKNPHLSQFVNNPENALFVVTVHEYVIAGFHNSQPLVMDSLTSSIPRPPG